MAAHTSAGKTVGQGNCCAPQFQNLTVAAVTVGISVSSNEFCQNNESISSFITAASFCCHCSQMSHARPQFPIILMLQHNDVYMFMPPWQIRKPPKLYTPGAQDQCDLTGIAGGGRVCGGTCVAARDADYLHVSHQGSDLGLPRNHGTSLGSSNLCHMSQRAISAEARLFSFQWQGVWLFPRPCPTRSSRSLGPRS